MKKALALSLALSVFSTDMLPAYAAPSGPVGARFMHGLGKQQLVEAIIEALMRDPTGMSLINAQKCATAGDRSCATVHDLLVEVLAIDPRATVDGVPLTDVSQMPGFVMKLELRTAPTGRFFMSCMKRSGKTPSGWISLRNCVPRSFKPGERAYIDPDTGNVIFAEDCTNPVGRPEKPTPCIELDVMSEEDDELRVAQYGGPTDLTQEDACPATIMRAGESDEESLKVQECADAGCTFEKIDAKVRRKRWWDGSFVLHKGLNHIRLNPKVLDSQSGYYMVLCLTHRNPATQAKVQSCGVGVDWYNYEPKRNHARGASHVATVYYTDADLKAAKAKTVLKGKPSDLFWHFDQSCD